MKLITYRYKGEENIGVIDGDHVRPIIGFEDMNDFIIRYAEEYSFVLGKGILLSRVEVLSPIPHPLQDVLCLGLNYTEHAKEAKGYSDEAFSSRKEDAIYFSKRVDEAVAHKGIVPAHEDLTSRLDYEVELGVILGRDAKDVKKDEVSSYIFGYTIINDISARDLQTRHKQWYFGKSLDGFCPMGPCIVTANEVSYPPDLRISSTVNGERRQDSRTSFFIHDIAEVVSELSQGMTLKAGTIIATGTPKGVAMGMETPVFLKKGDTVVCSIEGIGDLENTIG